MAQIVKSEVLEPRLGYYAFERAAYLPPAPSSPLAEEEPYPIVSLRLQRYQRVIDRPIDRDTSGLARLRFVEGNARGGKVYPFPL